jgi:probable rRNA maturation factor
MIHEINVQFDAQYQGLAESVQRAAETVLKIEQAPPGAVSIVLTDADALRSANKQFAGIDKPTDVLSFSDGEAMPDAEGVYFGDVLIAVPIAARQAEHGGHTLEEEVCLLTVHGMLHLLGQDHAEPDDKAAMWSRQKAILALLEIDGSIMETTP